MVSTSLVVFGVCLVFIRSIEAISKRHAIKDLELAIGCEGKGPVNLSCKPGTRIFIERANFGRTKPDSQICPYEGKHLNDVHCVGKYSYHKVRELCEWKTHCSIKPSTAVFGDPCFNTYKYLEVIYSCQTYGEKKTAIACDGGSVTLSCEHNTKINIIKSNFGRTKPDPQVCPYGRPHNNDVNCLDNGTSFRKVRHLCQAEKRCKVNVVPGSFGDPCVGTYKYLEIHYNCV